MRIKKLTVKSLNVFVLINNLEPILSYIEYRI